MLTGSWNPHDEDDENLVLDVEWVFIRGGKYVYSVRAENAPVA